MSPNGIGWWEGAFCLPLGFWTGIISFCLSANLLPEPKAAFYIANLPTFGKLFVGCSYLYSPRYHLDWVR